MSGAAYDMTASTSFRSFWIRGDFAMKRTPILSMLMLLSLILAACGGAGDDRRYHCVFGLQIGAAVRVL
jgi:hypothetical protein